MILRLVQTPGIDSIYGAKGAITPLPHRMRFVHPDAYPSLLAIVADYGLVLSDLFRSLASQIEAHRTKQGTARPGFSAHNFGLALDLDVGRALSKLGFSKRVLDDRMLERGWMCYRGDHNATALEAWHYTFQPPCP